MSADQAVPATTVPDAVQEQLAKLPAIQRELAERQMASAMKHVASYDAEDNPQLVAAWSKKVDAELEKLKELVELVQKER